MKKLLKSNPALSVLGGITGTLIVGMLFFTIHSVLASPTAAPPDGGPTFPLTGPQGPAGPAGAAGATGPQGPAGTFGTCRVRTSTCNHGPYAGCTTPTLYVTSGWKMTGADCEVSGDSHNYYSSISSTSVSCSCHDKVTPAGATCRAFIWECQ